MHRIEDQLDAMTGATVFLTLDLTKGYHQLLIDEESREVTAFSTPEGLFQWKVLPLGMKTLGAVFQRVMDTIFEGLQPSKVVVYIDNITVFLPTMEQHVTDLDLVIQRLAKANLKVSVTKCVLARPEVKVLSHLVSVEGIKPNPAKVEAIARMKPPTDASGVRLFMGSIIFYGRFIAGVATIVEPIWALTRQRTVFNWSPACSAAFEHFKTALMSEPILKLPCWDWLFVIETDASATGIGAALTQLYEDQLMPVSYASWTLGVHERQYSATEREGLAVVWAVDHFQSYVMGTPFVILTNHAALTSLGTKTNLDGKLLRFAERLSSYQYEIVFRPGQQNWLADMLSVGVV